VLARSPDRNETFILYPNCFHRRPVQRARSCPRAADRGPTGL